MNVPPSSPRAVPVRPTATTTLRAPIGVFDQAKVQFRQVLLPLLALAGMNLENGCLSNRPKTDPELLCTAVYVSALEAPVPLGEPAILRQHSREEVLEEVSGRLRQPGSQLGILQVDDTLRLTFQSHPEAYEALKRMHPDLVQQSGQEDPRDLGGGCARSRTHHTPEWEAIETERRAENEKRLFLQGLAECYDLEGEGFSAPSLSVLPPELTGELLANPENRLFSSVQTPFLKGNTMTLPYFGDPNEKDLGKQFPYALEQPLDKKPRFTYVTFPAVPGDDLEWLLQNILRKPYREQTDELIPKIRLISPENGWTIPLSLLEPTALKNDIFWIAFRDFKMPSYPSGEVDTRDRRTLRHQKQAHQSEYHTERAYPVFTDSTRAELLKTTRVREVPETGDGFVCHQIYTLDPANEASARYTYPETLDLIKSVAQKVNDTYHNVHGLPAHLEIRMVVNALGRTEEYQEKLRGVNGNATDEISSHSYYNAADLDYNEVHLVDTITGAEIRFNGNQHPKFIAGVKALMFAEIAKAVREDKAFAVFERGQTCFHVVGRAAEEKEEKE